MFGIRVFEFQPAAGPRKIGAQDPVDGRQGPIEQHMFNTLVVVKIF
jgi:hypothetical protein